MSFSLHDVRQAVFIGCYLAKHLHRHSLFDGRCDVYWSVRLHTSCAVYVQATDACISLRQNIPSPSLFLYSFCDSDSKHLLEIPSTPTLLIVQVWLVVFFQARDTAEQTALSKHGPSLCVKGYLTFHWALIGLVHITNGSIPFLKSAVKI